MWSVVDSRRRDARRRLRERNAIRPLRNEDRVATGDGHRARRRVGRRHHPQRRTRRTDPPAATRHRDPHAAVDRPEHDVPAPRDGCAKPAPASITDQPVPSGLGDAADPTAAFTVHAATPPATGGRRCAAARSAALPRRTRDRSATARPHRLRRRRPPPRTGPSPPYRRETPTAERNPRSHDAHPAPETNETDTATHTSWAPTLGTDERPRSSRLVPRN